MNVARRIGQWRTYCTLSSSADQLLQLGSSAFIIHTHLIIGEATRAVVGHR